MGGRYCARFLGPGNSLCASRFSLGTAHKYLYPYRVLPPKHTIHSLFLALQAVNSIAIIIPTTWLIHKPRYLTRTTMSANLVTIAEVLPYFAWVSWISYAALVVKVGTAQLVDIFHLALMFIFAIAFFIVIWLLQQDLRDATAPDIVLVKQPHTFKHTDIRPVEQPNTIENVLKFDMLKGDMPKFDTQTTPRTALKRESMKL